MKSKTILLFSVLVLFSLMTHFVFAEEILEPQSSTIPTPDTNELSAEQQANIAHTRQMQRIGDISLVGSLILSLIIGIILMVYMVKKSPRMPHLILQGIIFIAGIIWLILMIFGFLSQFVRYGSVPDTDAIEIGWPFILLLLSSGYLGINLIRNKDFAKKMRYTLGLFFGMIVMGILAMLSTIIIGIIFEVDPLGVGILIALLFFAGVIGAVVLGIIGFLIDKSHK